MKMNKTTVTMDAKKITTPLVSGWKRLVNSVRFFTMMMVIIGSGKGTKVDEQGGESW